MYRMKEYSFSLICILFICSFLLTSSAQADWTLNTLHQFSGADGGILKQG
jgi:hypothetical protein